MRVVGSPLIIRLVFQQDAAQFFGMLTGYLVFRIEFERAGYHALEVGFKGN